MASVDHLGLSDLIGFLDWVYEYDLCGFMMVLDLIDRELSYQVCIKRFKKCTRFWFWKRENGFENYI